MQMLLTARLDGERLQIPLLPDRLSVRTSALTIAAQIISVGEVKIPRGTSLIGYSWSGTLPAEQMKSLPFVQAWQDPKTIVALLQKWMQNGEKLNLLVTEAIINVDVFIEIFSYEYAGNGNISYSITLTAKRALTIQTVPAPPVPPRTPTSPIPAPGRTTPAQPTRASSPTKRAPSPTTGKPGGGTTGHPGGVTGTTNTTTAKPFETISDIARRIYGTNTAVKLIVDANKAALAKVATAASTVIGKVTDGLKLFLPKAPPQPVKPTKGGGGTGRDVKSRMTK